MEKEKLLFKIPVKIISTVIAFVFFFNQIAVAGSFDDAVNAGRSFGLSSINKSPQQSDVELVPRYQDAQQQKGDYQGFYTNPSAAMSQGQQQEITQFIYDSKQQRQKFDLSSDSTFGNKCLQYETITENGQEIKKCTMWSLSKDILTRDYTDCEKVMIPQYEQSQLQTCTTEVKVDTHECTINHLLQVNTTQVTGPCSDAQITSEPNQIFASCKDNAELYRVNMGTYCRFGGDYSDVMPAMCAGGHCTICFDQCPIAYTINSENDLPANSEFLGEGIANIWVYGGPGNRTGCGYLYKYYKVLNPSTLEKVFLIPNSNCSEQNIQNWTEQCSVKDYIVCKADGTDCVALIENGEETGNTFQPECKSTESAIDGIYTTTCQNICNSNYATCTPSCVRYSNCSNCIPTNEQCNISVCETCQNYYCDMSGEFPTCYYNNCSNCQSTNCGITTALSCSSCTGSYNDQQCMDACFATYCPEYCTTEISPYGYFVCPSSNQITVNERTVTSTPSEIVNTEQQVYFQGKYFTITRKRQLGGSGVKETPNEWHTKITFACENKSSNCANLEQQGCVFVSSVCNNENCTEYLNTYRCGEDKITGYQISYLCNGELKCIGTECGEVSYQTSNTFSSAVNASEILNMARVDSKKGENIEIFPGTAMQCMSSPENCCRPIVGSGITIGDMVKAGRSIYEIYSVASQGFEAVGYQWASTVVEYAHSFATKVGLTNATSYCASYGSEMLVTTSVETPLGYTATISSTLDSGMTVSTTATMPSGALATVGTVVAVVGAIVAAYMIYETLYNMTFSCSNSDYETGVKIGYRLCHYVDSISRKKYYFFTVRTNRYCCFNSILARIIHEQGRSQLGIPWRVGDAAEGWLNCRGFTPEELSSLDFSQIDLREYLQYVSRKTNLTDTEISNIQQSIKDKYRNAMEGN